MLQYMYRQLHRDYIVSSHYTAHHAITKTFDRQTRIEQRDRYGENGNYRGYPLASIAHDLKLVGVTIEF